MQDLTIIDIKLKIGILLNNCIAKATQVYDAFVNCMCMCLCELNHAS